MAIYNEKLVSDKTFEHLTLNNFNDIEPLTTVNIGGMRFYKSSDNTHFPSITTVLGKQPKKIQGLNEWRKRVGEEEANRIGRVTASRGTMVHKICEDYLNNETNWREKYKDKNLLAYAMFHRLKKEIDSKIGDVVLQEQPMYSRVLKVAGKCDLIATVENNLCVVDFKTSIKEKKEEWVEDYFLQCTAYAQMYKELTSTEINDIMIMLVTEQGKVQIFQKKAKDYMSKLVDVMNEFYENLNVSEVIK